MSVIYSIPELVTKARSLRASDIHIVCGIPIRIRVDGKLVNFDDNVMTPMDCEMYARDFSNHYEEIEEIGEQDLAIGMPDGSRCSLWNEINYYYAGNNECRKKNVGEGIWRGTDTDRGKQGNERCY